MPNTKARQRLRVAMEFGILIQPFVDLAKNLTNPSEQDYRHAIAKAHSGDSAWRATVKEYATFAPDLVMARELNAISHVNERLCNAVSAVIDQIRRGVDVARAKADFDGVVKQHIDMLYEHLETIPIEWAPEIFEANTPFTAYLAIRSAVLAGRVRLHYFDRYLKREFFSVFLAEVDRSIEVRLVTTEGQRDYGIQAVMDVSELARREFTDYRLIQIHQTQMHDRNLRVDHQVFTLGPGVAAAGIALTNFGPSDSTPLGHAALDSVIAAGTTVHAS